MSAEPGQIWWVHAAAAEARGAPALPGRVLELGVGKTEATLKLTAALTQGTPSLVVVFGVAGAYAGRGLDVGDLCVVDRDQLADEGVQAPDGYASLADLRLGTVGPFFADPNRSLRIAQALGSPVVSGATVSTCSSIDALSEALTARTGAAVETMEGAAIGRVCLEFEVPWVQVRSISNRCGDRDRGGWDLPRAKRRLHSALPRVASVVAP